jgi:hypothetical protein
MCVDKTTTTTTEAPSTTTTTLFPLPGLPKNNEIVANATLDSDLCGIACSDPFIVLSNSTEAQDVARRVLESLPEIPPALVSILQTSDPETLPEDDKKNMFVITGVASTYGGSAAVYVASILNGTNSDGSPLSTVQSNLAAIFQNLNSSQASDPLAMVAIAAITTGDLDNQRITIQNIGGIVQFAGNFSSAAANPFVRLAAGVDDPADNQLNNLGAILEGVSVTNSDKANVLVDIASGSSNNAVWNIVAMASLTAGFSNNSIVAVSQGIGAGLSAGSNTMSNIIIGATGGALPINQAIGLGQKFINTPANTASNVFIFISTNSLFGAPI